MRWQRWHLFGGVGGGYGAVSYLLHSSLKIGFWDVLRLAKAQPLFIQTFEKRGLLLFLPAAAIGQSGTMLNYRWQRKGLFTSTRFQPWPEWFPICLGFPTSCFKRMDRWICHSPLPKSFLKVHDSSDSTGSGFLLVLTLLYSGCSVQLLTVRSGCTAAGAENCPFGGGSCNNWFRRDFWILRFDQPRMNQVQFFFQGAIGVSLGVSRTIELHIWRFTGFCSQLFWRSLVGSSRWNLFLAREKKGELNSIPTELTYSLHMEKQDPSLNLQKKPKLQED